MSFSRCLLAVLFIGSQISISFIECAESNCPDVNSPIPMWSWGFARQCCDIFPHVIGSFGSGYEGGDVQNDKHYFGLNKISNGSIVYVATKDFPIFLKKFFSLPNDTRIILVSGLEDIGVPWELFHKSRSEYNQLWSLAPPSSNINMQNFILDPRLVRWYTQNFDMIGCGPFSCADNKIISPKMVRKVRPLPIGVDFHSRAGKSIPENEHFKNSVCQQRFELDQIKNNLKSFPYRPLAAIASFSCNNLNQEHYRITRGVLCQLLMKYSNLPSENSNSKHGNISIYHHSLGREEFWKALGTVYDNTNCSYLLYISLCVLI